MYRYGYRASATERGYDARWRRARRAYLRANALCRLCTAAGRTTAATVVDHVKPHRGNQALFWDETNWQPLCAPCHNAVKQAEERGGGLRGAGVDGTPLDPAHHWNRTGRRS